MEFRVSSVIISVVVLLMSDMIGGYESCPKDGFCTEKPAGYDVVQSEIDDRFQKIKENLDLKSMEITEEDEAKDIESLDDFNGNNGNCRSETEYIKPYSVNSNGTTKLIVQSKYYEQKIRITKCARDEDFYDLDEPKPTECFQNVIPGITGTCKNKYTQIFLYVYDNNNKKIQRHPISVSVCCFCNLSDEN